jgi:hypothetical protein
MYERRFGLKGAKLGNEKYFTYFAAIRKIVIVSVIKVTGNNYLTVVVDDSTTMLTKYFPQTSPSFFNV